MSASDIEQSKKNLFETTAITKAIAQMAIPTIISQLINLVYNIVDTFYIGRTGNPFMIASVTVSFTIFVMTVAFSNLFGTGGGSQMARLQGKGEDERARKTASFSFWCSIAASLAYSLLIALFHDPILKTLGASDATLPYANQYVFWTVIVGGPFTILSTTVAHLLRNAGYSSKASTGLSAGGILNIVLDPIFMFALLPKGHEVYGAGLATMLSNLCACIYLTFVYAKVSKRSNLNFSLKNAASIGTEDVGQVFAVGVPAALLTVLFDFSNMVLNACMARHGDLALAAIGICMKVERLPNAICLGLCQGTLPLIAYNYASKNRKRMDGIIGTSRKLGLAICAMCIVFFVLLAKKITGLFIYAGDDAENAMMTVSYAELFLKIRCLASPLQFLNYHSSFTLQAMGDGRDTLLHAFVRILMFHIPSILLLDRIFGMRLLAFSIVIGEFLGAILALSLLHRFLKHSHRNMPESQDRPLHA